MKIEKNIKRNLELIRMMREDELIFGLVREDREKINRWIAEINQWRAELKIENEKENKIKKKFERAKKELEQEKKQTFGIYINKEAIKKACKKEKLKPKELITKIFTRWLIGKGYLKLKK